MKTLWEFETPKFLVKLEIEPSIDPDTSWMDEEQLAEYKRGYMTFFDSFCRVYGPRNELLGEDVLCESSYYNPEEFVTAHRDKDPMNRNCSIMRARKGNNVVICHYFPDMLRIAIGETRNIIARTIETYNNLELRT